MDEGLRLGELDGVVKVSGSVTQEQEPVTFAAGSALSGIYPYVRTDRGTVVLLTLETLTADVEVAMSVENARALAAQLLYHAGKDNAEG